MDLNGKAGSRLAAVLFITFWVFALSYLFLWKPNSYTYYPYFQIDSTAHYTHNGVSIGEDMSEEVMLTTIFGNNTFELDSFLSDDYEYCFKSKGKHVEGGLSFPDMQISVIDDTLCQIRFFKSFRGINSYFKSLKYYKTLCYTFKNTYGNGLSKYSAWEWGQKNMPKDDSFGIRILRDRIGWGFYDITLLITLPEYEDEDLFSGRSFFEP